jgi:hypothetical protein
LLLNQLAGWEGAALHWLTVVVKSTRRLGGECVCPNRTAPLSSSHALALAFFEDLVSISTTSKNTSQNTSISNLNLNLNISIA